MTIDSLHDVFDSAKRIMKWLASTARAIATGHLKDPGSGNTKDPSAADVVHWTTPLGLPAMQHYRMGVSSPSLAVSCMPRWHIMKGDEVNSAARDIATWLAEQNFKDACACWR